MVYSDEEFQQRTITTLVRDKPGVLARIASMFRRRGFNIASLAVGRAEEAGLSRMTFVVEGPKKVVKLVAAQLEKLVDTVEVLDVTDRNFVWRELALIKVKTPGGDRSEVTELCNVFRANILDMGVNNLTVEVTGGRNKIDSLIRLLDKFGIIEVMRTGRLAVLRDSFSEGGLQGEFLPIQKYHTHSLDNMDAGSV